MHACRTCIFDFKENKMGSSGLIVFLFDFQKFGVDFKL